MQKTKIYIIAALAVIASVVTISAAYASQSTRDHVSFSSDLPTVLKFLDSAILSVRELGSKPEADNIVSLDSYSLASSNPVLFKYMSIADEAYKSSPAAPVQVMIEQIEANYILKDADFKDRQYDVNTKLDTYTAFIEMDGKYFELTLQTPDSRIMQ